MNQSEQRAVDRAMRITVSLIFAIALFGPPSAPAQASDYAERLRVATEEVNQGDFSAAMADLEAAVRLEPGTRRGGMRWECSTGRLETSGTPKRHFGAPSS